MKPLLFCSVAASLFVSLSHQTPNQTLNQKKPTLQGKWRAIAATSNGESAPKHMLPKLTVVFYQDTVSLMGAKPIRFRVNTKVKPAQIDFLNSRNQVGIYSLDKDTLKLCTGQNGDRPTSFATKKYTDHTYLLLKRVKK